MLRRTELLLNITAKHTELTDAIREYVETKTAKLPKYYDNINKIAVIIDGNDGGHCMVELIASAEHSKIFVVKEAGNDMYACIDLAVHKIERQLSKQKEKERSNKHHGNNIDQNMAEPAE